MIDFFLLVFAETNIDLRNRIAKKTVASTVTSGIPGYQSNNEMVDAYLDDQLQQFERQ